MEKLEKKERLKALAGDNVSNWESEALQRQAEEGWRLKSAAIALQLLRSMRTQSLSQKDLAARVGVSPQYINKIVKGSENLSLETITKLEKALTISLITIFSGEKVLIGSGQGQATVAVDYFRENIPKPERVLARFSTFYMNSTQLS